MIEPAPTLTATTPTSVSFKAIKWDVEDTPTNLNLFIHGLTSENKRVAVKVTNFQPYVYVELDPRVNWQDSWVRSEFDSYFRAKLKKSRDGNGSDFYVKRTFVESKVKGYYMRKAKFFRVHFKNLSSMNRFCNLLTEYQKTTAAKTAAEAKEKNKGGSNDASDAADIATTGGGGGSRRLVARPIRIETISDYPLRFMVHELKAARMPVLQFTTVTRTSPSGWINVPLVGESVNERASFSTSNIQVELRDYTSIRPVITTKTTDPFVMSYDIECTSGDASGNTFTHAKDPKDEVICISLTYARLSQPESEWKQVCLVNASRDRSCPENVGDRSEIVNYRNEADLLIGFRDWHNELDPDIVVSYNGLSFDDKYLMRRATMHGFYDDFMMMGRIYGSSAVKDRAKWSSSAYKDQKFKYMDVPGRLHLDLFPFISKEFPTLPGYTLNLVSEFFLNERKVDLPAREMIQLHHRGSPDDISRIVYYCNHDTVLPFKLLRHLKAYIGLSETSNVVKVTMSDLLTRGQQRRVYSLAYYFCYQTNVVLNSQWDSYDPTHYEKKFAGATVQNPKIGLHKRIATFDFASLYPTTIIAYNLCFSTYIPPEEPDPEDRDSFWLFEWEDHYGCEHDHGVRKSKVAKDKIICAHAPGMKPHRHRFWKREVKQGVIPQILVFLLDARKETRAELERLNEKIAASVEALKTKPTTGGSGNGSECSTDIDDPSSPLDLFTTQEQIDAAKVYALVLDKRQNGFKISANSMYGGLGSDYSETPFYPAAACTTYNGRTNIQRAIDVAKVFRDDTDVVYGDTDSAMIKFMKSKTMEDTFEIALALEKEFKKHFPYPMEFQLEKVYETYLLFSKKRYVGHYRLRLNKPLSIDRKGVISKRRDNFSLVRDVFTELTNRIEQDAKKWECFRILGKHIEALLNGSIPYQKFVITMSLGSGYKDPKKLAHVVVSEKMKQRGKYVVAGTRISYLYVDIGVKNAKKYELAEDPDWYLENLDTMRINYMTYFEKFITPIDEIFAVRFGVENVLKNLFSLLQKGRITDVKDYFYPKFEIEDTPLTTVESPRLLGKRKASDITTSD